VALVITISKERVESIIRVERISEETLFRRSVFQLLVTASVVPSLLILSTLMVATRSYITTVLTRATRRHMPEDGIIYSHHCENLRTYRINQLASVAET
jgi:hypothetical protein